MRHEIWIEIKKISYQLDQLIKYEAGELNQDNTVALFQALIDSGLAWSLPGSYHRTAEDLIKLGICRPSAVNR